MAASSSFTASAPHFCCPKWRSGSFTRLPSLVETRKLRASYKRCKAVLTISTPSSIQFRCRAVSTTMEVMTVANESLLTGEEAVIIAAAAEAVALARAAVELAKKAVQCFEDGPRSSTLASESVPDPPFPSFKNSPASRSVLNPSFRSSLASKPVLNPSFKNSLASRPVLDPSFKNTFASESVLDLHFPSFKNLLALESVPNPLPAVEASFLNPSPSLKNPSLASEPVLSPSESPTEIEEIPVAVGSTRQRERREKRQRAAETAAARVVPVRSGGRRKGHKQRRGDDKDPVKLFKRVAGSYKTLTAAEERELSAGVQDLLQLQAIQKQLRDSNGQEPSFEMWATACQLDQRTLHKRLDSGTRAKQKMVRSNIRLVVSIAKNFIGAGLDFEDLIQEGCSGLIKGVDKFDGTKGFKFSTYAHWWIKQAIRRALSERSRLIQLPIGMVNASYKVKDAIKQLKDAGKTGRLSNEEIAKVSGLSKKTVQSVFTLPKNPISFDAMIGNEYNVKLSDTIPCREEDSPEHIYNKESTKTGIEMVLDTLNPREKQVVRWRYGLEDGRAKTLQEIGEILSISRERVRQVESSAFRKLKSKKRIEILQKYIS